MLQVSGSPFGWLPQGPARVAHLGVSLPSGESASDFLEGKSGSAARLTMHFLGRSALVGVGLALAGLRGKELVKCSLAGSAAIEGFVLAYAAMHRETK